MLTDAAVPRDRTADRPRLPFETALDGLFAAGDIRVGSMKRVAAAVGEGSSAIRSVHQYLAQFQEHDRSGQSAPPRLPARAARSPGTFGPLMARMRILSSRWVTVRAAAPGRQRRRWAHGMTTELGSVDGAVTDPSG